MFLKVILLNHCSGADPNTWKRSRDSQGSSEKGVLGHHLPFFTNLLMKTTYFQIKRRGTKLVRPTGSAIDIVYILSLKDISFIIVTLTI